ncbi:uncharacterized protein DUF4268 [Maribacter vaceletii]|uniref:Uncharacterized protein DUF4268 n=1 Tax=Maribacter vaceletii TaxID=1206816 RepID=A0A495EE73_9FLAO|nr:DUF4268 domain-containing protein [Maribacter vaceletii]RKR14853.1 uncharacterized protein DUF4268 [Maribacter vaceletii]
MNLGRIKQVALREIWKHEATNFTQWLALPENLELLSDEINIELSLIDTEYNVGRFNVDIYAEESGLDRKVIIENQLERTDHDHLGKLITYASGLDAEIIIWIVKEVLEEHKQAIDWLNENTDEKINFFAVRMEVWKIGNSEPAPKFHIVSQPNNWAKAIKQSVKSSVLSETKQLQLKFWVEFKTYIENENIKLRLRKPYPQHWYDISYSGRDSHITLTLNTQSKEMACEVYIPDSKETYKEFFSHKDAIENHIPGLKWFELPTKKACRIKKITKGNLTSENKWPEYFKWMAENAVLFQQTFSKY